MTASFLSSSRWLIYDLFKPTGRHGSAYPDEITPKGIVRRLHAMKRGGSWPEWQSVETREALARHLRLRWTSEMLAVMEAVDTFLSQHQPDQLLPFQQSIAEVIARDTSFWKQLLGMAGLTHQWGLADPFMSLSASEPSPVSAYWLDLVERCAQVPGRAEDAPADVLAPYITACRLSSNSVDVERLVRMSPQLPILTRVTGEKHAYPLMVTPTRDPQRDQRLMDAFERAGGDLQQLIQPHAQSLFIHDKDARLPAFLNYPIPLWSALALWGHEAARAWGQQQASTRAWNQHLHLEERATWCSGWNSVAHLHPRFYERTTTLNDRAQQILQQIRQSTAWAQPGRLQTATMDQVGDTHPLWAATALFPTILAVSHKALDKEWHQRIDVRGAEDHDGANLWWAVAQAARFSSDVPEAVQRLLSEPAVPCRANVRGEGLLIRLEGLRSALRDFLPFHSDQDLLSGLPNHPLLLVAQRWPEGVFGASTSGQNATAAWIWDKLDRELTRWVPGDPAPDGSDWTQRKYAVSQWALVKHVTDDAMATAWGPLVMAIGVMASLHEPDLADEVESRLVRLPCPVADAWRQRPLFQLALQHLPHVPQLDARWRHLNTNPPTLPAGPRRVRQRA